MITYEDIEPFKNGKLTEAPACGVPEIDKYIRFKRNFTVIGGMGNVGKTTLWLYILFVWAKNLNLKFLLFTNENDPKEMAMQMVEWYNAKWITDQTSQEIKLCIEWLNEHFLFLENDYKSTLKELLIKFYNIKVGGENYTAFDYDGVFIDPYNSIPVPTGYVGHYDNASMLRGFVKKNNVKVMVSMHPNTEAQRSRDEDGKSKVPHLTDLEMGSMWFNRSDDSVIVHRQTQIEDLKFISELHVQKIKHKRSGGDLTAHDNPITMVWSQSRAGRFLFTDSNDPIDTPVYDNKQLEIT